MVIEKKVIGVSVKKVPDKIHLNILLQIQKYERIKQRWNKKETDWNKKWTREDWEKKQKGLR